MVTSGWCIAAILGNLPYLCCDPLVVQVYLGVHAKSIIIGRNLLSMCHKLYSTEVVKLISVFIDAMRDPCQFAVLHRLPFRC